MKRFLLIYLCLVGSAFPQGARPPVTTLNGLSDVTITSPTNNQTLNYNSGTSKWQNGNAPAPALADLSDVSIVSTAGNQVLRWNSGSSKWVNYGPLAFSDISGSVTPAQMNSGAFASASSFWRGDGTWATIPGTGTIKPTTNLLIGDSAGNALDANNNGLNLTSSNFTYQLDGNNPTYFSITNSDTNGTDVNVYSGVVMTGGNGNLRIEQIGSFSTPGGMWLPDDGRIIDSIGGIGIAGASGKYITFSTDLGTTKNVKIGNGLMVNATNDPGLGVVNVGTGFRILNAAPAGHVLMGNGTSYVDGTLGGMVAVTSTVDQTATTETAHVVYTVPANSATAGRTYRITAWGNMDIGGTAITFTPTIRWGGTGGVSLLNTPTITTAAASGTNKAWRIVSLVTVRTTGASGTAVCNTFFQHHFGSAFSYLADEADSGTTAVTIDTTASKDLDLTWTLSATTGTPHVRTIGGTIEIVKP